MKINTLLQADKWNFKEFYRLQNMHFEWYVKFLHISKIVDHICFWCAGIKKTLGFKIIYVQLISSMYWPVKNYFVWADVWKLAYWFFRISPKISGNQVVGYYSEFSEQNKMLLRFFLLFWVILRTLPFLINSIHVLTFQSRLSVVLSKDFWQLRCCSAPFLSDFYVIIEL